MRFYQKRPPKKGDTKTEWKFLLFPTTIDLETRWLEWAEIKYEYKNHMIMAKWGSWYTVTEWLPIRWVS